MPDETDPTQTTDRRDPRISYALLVERTWERIMHPPPSLAGMTSWTAGLRLPEDGDTDAQPGKYIVKILFDDPAQLKTWCNWIMAHDEAWGGKDAG